MRISELLRPGLVRCNMEARSSEEVLRELVSVAATDDPNLNQDKAIQALLRRDREGAFTMGRGVAFPHVRLDERVRFAVLLATLPEGIKFCGSDDVLVRVVVMFIIPRGPAHRYLQGLAAFSTLLGNVLHFQNVINAANATQLIQYIDATGIRVKDQLHLRDIMSPPLDALETKSRVREAVVRLAAHHLDALPVVDIKHQMVGEVRASQVVKMGLGAYLSLVGSASVASHQSLFENFLRMHGDLPVERIMATNTLMIDAGATLFETGLRLVNANANQAYVVEKGRLVGVVRLEDLIRRLLLTRPE